MAIIPDMPRCGVVKDAAMKVAAQGAHGYLDWRGARSTPVCTRPLPPAAATDSAYTPTMMLRL